MSLVSCCLLAAGLLAGADPSAPLVPGQPLTGTFTAGETHTSAVTLEAGQFLRLSVVQDGADVVVTVIAPDGTRTRIDGADEPWWPELASVLGEPAGAYRLEIQAKKGGPSPRYRIESEPLRPATGRDRLRFRAERALAEGAARGREEGTEAHAAAVSRLQAALSDWATLDDAQGAALTWLQLAAAHYTARDMTAVLEVVPAALDAARRAGDQESEARAFFWRCIAQQYLSREDEALASCEQTLALERATGNIRGQTDVMGIIGDIYNHRGQPRKAIELLQRQLALDLQAGDHHAAGDVQGALGRAYANADELQAALESFRAAAASYHERGLRELEGTNLSNAAAVRDTLGDHAGALATFEETLALNIELGKRDRQAATYSNMGLSASAMGDSAKAMHLYGRALALFQELKDRRSQCRTLQRIGAEHNVLGQYDRAAAVLEEALAISVEIKNPTIEARVRASLAATRRGAGLPAEARALYLQAADLSPGEPTLQAEALSAIAGIDRDAGELERARQEAERALAWQETVRRKITSATLRSTFAGEARRTSDLYVDVLMALHQRGGGQGLDARALEASEAARARGLRDLLNEVGLNIREGVDRGLLEAEQAARESLSTAVDRQQRLAQQAPTGEEAREAARAVERLTGEWDTAREKVRAASPRLGALSDPPPLSVESLRRDVLDEDTLLLEYALGEKRSFVFVAGTEGVRSYELPARREIEAAASAAYAAWTRPGQRPSAPAAALRLSRMVLGPAREALGGRRLLVVADGALHYVPFAALPDPSRTGPMIERYEVVTAPSAAVVALLRAEGAQRAAPSRTLAALADPVFTRDDARLAARPPRAAPAAAPGGEALTNALRDTGGGALSRLPFTRREAEAILALVPPGQRKAAFDFEASRSTATDSSLADYRFVHFATHGFLNGAHPELSGIVLSLVGRDGAAERGFLTTTDVFHLHLNADMVTLSGCRTALGQEMRGEGLVGLARGFMYAGTPRVLASLWKVDDAATAALMKRVYAGILTRHLPPAAALRAAQLDLRREPRFHDPFYWAGFQLQGEWR